MDAQAGRQAGIGIAPDMTFSDNLRTQATSLPRPQFCKMGQYLCIELRDGALHLHALLARLNRSGYCFTGLVIKELALLSSVGN